jgi:dihydroorotase
MDTLTLIRPDDWHLHLRDGAALEAVVGATARQFARAIVMPNLKPPVTTVAQALAYRERILAALGKAVAVDPACAGFEPLMTLYLTDRTSPDEIVRARASGPVHAVKLYPAGATTNSDAGVSSVAAVRPALEAMGKRSLALAQAEFNRDLLSDKWVDWVIGNQA